VQALLLTLTAWIAVEPFVRPRSIPRPRLAESDASQIPGSEVPRLGVGDLAGIWKRALRQALIEPKAPEPPPPKPAPPPPPPPVLPRLSATFVEQGRAWGLFVDEKGSARVRTASDRVGDYLIVGISPGMATLSREEKTYEVRVQTRMTPVATKRRGKEGP
jgi:hypothetical protein